VIAAVAGLIQNGGKSISQLDCRESKAFAGTPSRGTIVKG